MLAAGKANSYEEGHFRAVAWNKSPVDQNICTCENTLIQALLRVITNYFCFSLCIT